MLYAHKYWKKLMILLVSLSLPLFAACGGGGGDESPPAADSGDVGVSVGGALLCFALVLTSGNDSCVTAATSGSSGSSGGTGSSGSSGSGGSSGSSSSDNSTLIQPNDEMEPNNDLINANVPLFAGFAGNGSTSQQTGWKVSGRIHDIDDLRDSFMLTPRRTYRYRVALCPPEGTSCQDQVGIDPFTVFWRVLDQDGNELLTSEVSASNKNFITLDAGVLYYVTVDAGDTMGVEVGYQLYVYELQ